LQLRIRKQPMAQSALERPVETSGFTLVEVIAAAFVLAIALLAAAAATRTAARARKGSKYMPIASRLASEKLDDVTRRDANDPSVCVPAGSKSVGSLTSDVTKTTTCPGGASDRVSYFDDVTLGPEGSYSETISSTSGGVPVYVSTIHSADGSISISTSEDPPSKPPTFHRRWIVKRNSSAGGPARITVRIALLDRKIQPPLSFQMTTAGPK
jgi:prepilin-type N-terminal cleavage/methylation domain-containing protein